MMCVLMPFITVGVIGRYVFNKPILGDVEIVEFVMVAIVMCGLASTQAHEHHISVKLVVDRLHPKVQAVVDIFNFLIVIVILMLIAYQSYEQAVFAFHNGESSDIIEIPVFYFRFLVPLGFLAWALESFLKVLRSIALLKGEARQLSI